MRAKATGRRVIAGMPVATVCYGVVRPARVAGNLPPCHTWQRQRAWHEQLASQHTQENDGTAPPLNSHPSSPLTCSLVRIILYQKFYLPFLCHLINQTVCKRIRYLFIKKFYLKYFILNNGVRVQ